MEERVFPSLTLRGGETPELGLDSDEERNGISIVLASSLINTHGRP
jgi:hypothetical protein